MAIQPRKNFMVVIPQLPADRTAGGLYIPEGASPDGKRQVTCTGKVLAIGPDVTEVAVGDTIIFDRYSAQEIKHEGKDLWIVSELTTLGVVV